MKEEPSEFNDDDYEYRSILQLFRNRKDHHIELIQPQEVRKEILYVRRMEIWIATGKG